MSICYSAILKYRIKKPRFLSTKKEAFAVAEYDKKLNANTNRSYKLCCLYNFHFLKASDNQEDGLPKRESSKCSIEHALRQFITNDQQ